jgi:hypothetical protein
MYGVLLEELSVKGFFIIGSPQCFNDENNFKAAKLLIDAGVPVLSANNKILEMYNQNEFTQNKYKKSRYYNDLKYYNTYIYQQLYNLEGCEKWVEFFKHNQS